MYKHIIWDWNGTLLNDVSECVQMVNQLLAARKLPVLSVERYRDEVDFPVINFYRRLGFTFETESYEEVAHEYIAGYITQVPKCRLQAGAVEVLQNLNEAGYTHSLLSAYHQQRLKEAVALFGLTKWFIKQVGLNDYYAHSKVENGKRWIQELPYPVNEVLFVGDMLHDYEVAQAMGVDCVLLTCGHQSKKKLTRCGVPMFDGLYDLKDWLLQK
jgi:phosphoglycolate phosphatase